MTPDVQETPATPIPPQPATLQHRPHFEEAMRPNGEDNPVVEDDWRMSLQDCLTTFRYRWNIFKAYLTKHKGKVGVVIGVVIGVLIVIVIAEIVKATKSDPPTTTSTSTATTPTIPATTQDLNT